jgi:hypothetical protein
MQRTGSKPAELVSGYNALDRSASEKLQGLLLEKIN